jgi:endoglucanase
MTDRTTSFLKELIQLPGLSAYEQPVRKRIQQEWEPLVDDLATNRLGSLYGTKFGTASEPRKKILIATHMDAIGLMVSQIDQDILRVTEVGGLDPRVLPGQRVVVHGRQELPGLLVQPPLASLPEGTGSGPIAIEHLMVDVGLSPGQLQRAVRVGDLVSFAQEPIEIGKDHIAGHSMDNRASIVALTYCLYQLQSRLHTWDLIAVATTQEEETMVGALTSSYELQPEIAIAVDVTWARGPGLPEYKTFPLGEGPTNVWGPNIHPAVFNLIEKTAEQVEIPLAKETTPRHSGTDAYALQIAREGVPTGVICIPLSYMHTPVEVVSRKDLRRTGRLIAEVVAGLEPDFELKTE